MESDKRKHTVIRLLGHIRYILNINKRLCHSRTLGKHQADGECLKSAKPFLFFEIITNYPSTLSKIFVNPAPLILLT